MDSSFRIAKFEKTDFTTCKTKCNKREDCVAFDHTGDSCKTAKCPICDLNGANGRTPDTFFINGDPFHFTNTECVAECDEIFHDSSVYDTYIKLTPEDGDIFQKNA